MSSANDSPAESSTMSSSQSNSAAMVLSIRTLEHQTKPVTISRDASVLDLKHAVQGAFQIDSNRQRLIFQGKMMKDGQSLTEYGKCHLPAYLSCLSLFLFYLPSYSYPIVLATFEYVITLRCDKVFGFGSEVKRDAYKRMSQC